MTSLVNVTASQLIQTDPHYELVYLTVSLLVAALSALVASFLGLRRRRQQRYDSTTSTPIHNVDGRPHGVRKDTLRLQTYTKCAPHDPSFAAKDRLLLR